MIQLDQVAKSYDSGRTHIVDALDLSVPKGALLVLLGESGCGKTTTLKMINRLIEPTAGAISVDGKDTRSLDPVALRRRIGYVFQGVGLFPHMTVAENVGVVPQLLGWEPERIAERVTELLDLVGLAAGEFGPRNPDALSGGQRQRVGVARALAAEPPVVLMDEPFGALDPVTRDTLQTEYRRIHDALGLTTVMVTHDMTEALLLADTIAVMEAGKIVRSGSPAELLREPGHPTVDQLLRTPMRHAERLKALVDPEADA